MNRLPLAILAKRWTTAPTLFCHSSKISHPVVGDISGSTNFNGARFQIVVLLTGLLDLKL